MGTASSDQRGIQRGRVVYVDHPASRRGLRVVEVIIDGFADLNANARALFAVPDAGFDE
jgi:hypothetical protein